MQHVPSSKAPHAALSFRAATGPVILLTAIFFLNFLSRIILAPLTPAMEDDLHLGHGDAGFFFFLLSAGYFVSMIGAGYLSSRVTHKNTICLSAAAVGLALLGISLSDGATALRVGFFMIGLASGIYLPSGIATLTGLMSSHHWGKGVAIHEMAPNLGFVAAPLIGEGLLRFLSWRGVFAVLGIAGLAAAGLFARFGRGGDCRGEAPNAASLRKLIGLPSFWIMVVLFGLGITGTFGIYAMLPLYLVSDYGMERRWANTLISLSRLSGLVTAFVAGWATDRLGARGTLTAALVLTGAATVLLGTNGGDWILVMVFIQAMLAGCFFPAAFVALSQIGPANARHVVVSLAIPVAFVLGGGVIPAGIGMLGDAGSFALGIALAGGLILLGSTLPQFLSGSGNERAEK